MDLVNNGNRMPIRPVALLLLGYLMQIVKAADAKDIGSQSLVEMLGCMSNRQEIHAALGIISLICLIIAMVASLFPSNFNKPHSVVITYASSVLCCIFLIAFTVCGCYFHHSDGPVTLCQKLCLCLGILLFIGGLVLFVLAIFGCTQWEEENAFFAKWVFLSFCSIFLVAFIFAACRQWDSRMPFTVCHIIFITLSVSLVVSLTMPLVCIMGLKALLAFILRSTSSVTRWWKRIYPSTV
ncbi:uncharacterized protein BXIN_1808 [Babesia sp. Xinjiang]|uniref:uncharacterized protein n=1 Tax=Babesia sp. Xinjiang TaxID=462227 RepID=UPI000A23FC84|nr:uncharacterized protein BXIN_1611 [Babesia sp. Xinjiang]XP_028871477.1 uncharacterized protein BXIN_1808 [Babesia sp. Xinjiang]ORM40938.1 hypothetical protein BXIN_1611 [Babesia sp. Xinjiang]ORM41021.1 hypothetical protein BXIN_1808 [Babesia sp. Xinjiang]